MKVAIKVGNNTTKRSINFSKVTKRIVNVINNVFIGYNSLVLKDKLSIVE